MILNTETVKRCGIFLFFDKDGIADEYVIHMIDDLKKSIDHMLVVVNGFVESTSYAKLEKAADDIICRTNTGFDVGGYRDGLFHIGWRRLAQYDELVMFNYTFFGPVYPFKVMFDEMKTRDISFWGITKHLKTEDDPFQCLEEGYIPEHIQSHFLVLRNDLFTSYYFKDFMFNRVNPNSYLDSIISYEVVFTSHFEKMGFKWDVYTDEADFEGYAYNPIMVYTREMIEKGCPIIKRRSFFTDYNDFLLNSCGETSVHMYKWLLENRPEYMDLIWDNILRLESMSSINRALGLSYIQESYDTDYQDDMKAGVFIIAEDTSKMICYKECLKQIPSFVKVYIYGSRENIQKTASLIKADIQKCMETERPDYLEALKEAKRISREDGIEIIGIARMNRSDEKKPFSSMFSCQYSDWTNLFYNREVIGNTLRTFGENHRMGMLIPPMPDFGDQFEENHDMKPVIGSFWIRTKELENIDIDSFSDDREFLDRLVVTIQKNGAFTGITYSDKYYSTASINDNYMARENNKVIFKKFVEGKHKDLCQIISDAADLKRLQQQQGE